MGILQEVKVKGNNYECGYQHGEQAREKIEANLDFYHGWWLRNLGMTRKNVYEYADGVIATSKKFDPELVEEMRGIADAVNTDIESVAAMNGRYELAWGNPEQLMGGCTCIAVTRHRSEANEVMLAQNWDYRIGVRGNCIVLNAQVEEKPGVLIHTEAGIIGHKGINSKGIGLVINAMVSDKDRLGKSVPFFLVCRKVLDSPRFSEALRVALNAERSLSYNMMIAGEEAVIDIEAHPKDVSVIISEDGVLAHTNNFIGERALSVKDNFVLTEPSSINRYTLARDMLIGLEKHSFESFKDILKNHFDHPTGICYHPDQDIGEDHWEETISSVFMVPEKLLFMCTDGPPCSNEYQGFIF